MAAKKKTSKKKITRKKKSASKASPKKPSKAMLKEIKEVFAKHNFKGTTILIHPTAASSVGAGALGLTGAANTLGLLGAENTLVPDPSMLNCQPPKKPTFLTINHPDGSSETGFACL